MKPEAKGTHLKQEKGFVLPKWLTNLRLMYSPGSEAGGEDALVGNVNKLMVTPPGYPGAQRKGHLVFDACFESGEYLMMSAWVHSCELVAHMLWTSLFHR